MHFGTLISKKLDRIDEAGLMMGFLVFIAAAGFLFLLVAICIASYNDVKKQNLERKAHDIQITNTK